MQVRIDNFLPIGKGDIVGIGGWHTHTGVVEEEVEPPKCFFCRIEKVAHGVFIADVGRYHESPRAIGPRQTRGLFQWILPTSGQGDRPAILQQGDSRRPADTAARTRDDRYLSVSTH